MVGKSKVVINGLGTSDETNLGAGNYSVIGKLLDGIHRVISADVDKAIDLKFIEHLEDLLVKLFVLIDVGELVTT